MSVIDQLEIIEGYFEGDYFMMRGIAGNAVEGAYKANELRLIIQGG